MSKLLKNLLFSSVNSVLKVFKKASHVIVSSKISDHWKEKAVLGYACIILNNSFYVLSILVIFSLVIIGFTLLSNQFSLLLFSLLGLLESIFIVFAYIQLRKLFFA